MIRQITGIFTTALTALRRMLVARPLFRTVRWAAGEPRWSAAGTSGRLEYRPSNECAHSGALQRLASDRLGRIQRHRRAGARRLGVTA